MSIAHYGPRKLTLGKLDRHKEIPKLKSPTPGSALDSTPAVVKGNIRLTSSLTPGLQNATDYTINFSQTVAIDGKPQTTFSSTRSFHTAGSPYILDPSHVDSVYPPPGHSDYWSMLNCV